MDRTNLDRLDEQLKQLAISAQQHLPLTQGRQLALRQMVNGILQSGRLCRPQRGQFSGVYEEIYDEALQELLLYICQKIDKYNPERGSVMAWVNVLFERRFFKEAILKILDKQELQRINIPDLDEIDPPESTPSLTEIIKQCIELDAENLFKNEHIENHPQANFQALVRRRLLGQSWKEISAEFEIKLSTVSRFYDRCLNKYSAKLKEYCTNM